MLKRSIFLVLLLSLTNSVQAAELKRADFDNGLSLIVEEDHSAPVAIIEIWMRVGGRDELPGKTGLAHVFEHMMFKGSKKMGPGLFSKRIAEMGGKDNAFTSTDFTGYFEIIPSDKINEVLDMELDRFSTLTLAAEEFAKEIEVIKEERRLRTDDNPNSRMIEEMAAAALRLHPYRNPVIGWMQDLEGLTIEDVRAFFQKHYVPSNMIMVIVGDVDFDKVKKKVGSTFGRLSKQPASQRFNPAEPVPNGPKRLDVHLPAKLPVVAITMPVPVWQPGKNDKEAAALAVATSVLSSGRSAWMNRELVEKQRLAFSATANYDAFGMGLDLWTAFASLGPDQASKDFEAGFWALLDTLANDGPSEEKLRAVKRAVVASDVFAQDSLYRRAMRIGRMEVVGIGADNKDKWMQLVRSVSADDVKQAVRKWLRPSIATTATLIPEQAS